MYEQNLIFKTKFFSGRQKIQLQFKLKTNCCASILFVTVRPIRHSGCLMTFFVKNISVFIYFKIKIIVTFCPLPLVIQLKITTKSKPSIFLQCSLCEPGENLQSDDEKNYLHKMPSRGI